MSNTRGITLIEIVVVVSIIAILVLALAFSFQGWMGKYRVESGIKQIYVDLMNTRARAMTRNRFHFTDFPTATSYRLIEDTNGNSASNPGAGDNTLSTKTVDYAVTWAGGTIQFDNRGIVLPSATPLGATICIFTDYDGDGSNLSDFDPDSDCIVISQTRINTGKLTAQNTAGGACDDANCVVR